MAILNSFLEMRLKKMISAFNSCASKASASARRSRHQSTLNDPPLRWNIIGSDADVPLGVIVLEVRHGVRYVDVGTDLDGFCIPTVRACSVKQLRLRTTFSLKASPALARP